MNLYEALLEIDKITNKNMDSVDAKYCVRCIHNRGIIKINDNEFLLKPSTEEDEKSLQNLYKYMHDSEARGIRNATFRIASDMVFLWSLKGINVNLYRLKNISSV